MNYTDEFIEHHGVLGMKWGHRKSYNRIKKSTVSKRNYKKAKKEYQQAKKYTRDAKTEYLKTKNDPKMGSYIKRESFKQYEYAKYNQKQKKNDYKYEKQMYKYNKADFDTTMKKLYNESKKYNPGRKNALDNILYKDIIDSLDMGDIFLPDIYDGASNYVNKRK